MRQNVWIWNHYATNMFFDQAGRHYWFAENLIKEGYKPTIFCASTNHFSDNHIDTKGSRYSLDSVNNIPFIFVNTPEYKGNGKKRVLNMISFYKGLIKTAKEFAELNGKPDVILASSVHPLTLVAGIKIAKKFGVPCICEVRDLWPETLIAYNKLNKDSLITKILCFGEKWIYEKADKLIFTMEGGKDYIIDKRWNIEQGGSIDIDKVHHINNGVNLEVFNYNKEHYKIADEDLEKKDTFKVVYAGSIRLANNVKSIVDTALEIKKLGYKDIEFIIYGDGNDKVKLERYCIDNNVDNVVFKGFVNKKYIPYILSMSDLNIIHFEQNKIKKYGASLNKMFEYFASGKPILSDCEFGYDLINKYKAGYSRDLKNPIDFSRKIIDIYNLNEDEYKELCNGSIRASSEYDYKLLSKHMISVLESRVLINRILPN